MSKLTVLKAIVAVAIIGGGILVIMKDDPTISSEIDNIDPLPTQDQP
ncbi:hypothetical protein [Marinobacter subterrani]|uniref:Uncharacterized protein n=1 Tax=Marinobacter subterrani TaxID=1658765 RepID=A0A0J7LZY1_9GAMM|nr:hypothetical protein [Marinobacter subterrani]KMQ74450.1 hypothetical protein Msub_10633 [Marinobacter subterrani]